MSLCSIKKGVKALFDKMLKIHKFVYLIYNLFPVCCQP
jgi:hypothetical protein